MALFTGGETQIIKKLETRGSQSLQGQNRLELVLRKCILVERTFGWASKEMGRSLVFVFPIIKPVILLLPQFSHILERMHVYII